MWSEPWIVVDRDVGGGGDAVMKLHDGVADDRVGRIDGVLIGDLPTGDDDPARRRSREVSGGVEREGRRAAADRGGVVAVRAA